MKRWAFLTIAGYVVAGSLGCAMPAFQSKLGAPASIEDQVVAETARLSTNSSAKSKEQELPPEKAARLCLAAAEELHKSGHIDHAIAECELAQKHHPKLPGLSRKLASLYAHQGNFDKAIAEYQNELARTPKDADLLNDLGFCYYEQKDYSSAERHLRQAVSLKPQLQRAQANLGLVLGRQEKWKESLEAFKKAGSVGTAHANLAAMYHAAGRDEEALRECRIALGLEPKLKAASALLIKLEESARDQKAVEQTEAKLVAPAVAGTPSIQLAEARQELPSHDHAIKLSKPVVNRVREEPAFRPVR